MSRTNFLFSLILQLRVNPFLRVIIKALSVVDKLHHCWCMAFRISFASVEIKSYRGLENGNPKGCKSTNKFFRLGSILLSF